MARSVIASLAILKVNADHGADYIENFVPFAAECLRVSSQEIVSISELQVALKGDFGLEIPQGPLRTILDRAVSRGFVIREDRVYRRVPEALAKTEFETLRQRALREQTALVDRLITFSGSVLGSPWTENEAEDALLHYLADRGGSLVASSTTYIPLAIPAGSVPNAEFVLNSFIQHLHERDPDGFEYLTTAVKGSVLASVLYFDDLGAITRRFENIAVYLDTVVLLQALGRLGPERQTASRELLELARDLGASLHCFRDTLTELEGIHGFTARCLRSQHGRRRELWGAAEYLVSAGFSASDIDLMIEHLERDLRDLGVTVQDRPPHVSRLTVDEAELARRLRDRVRYRGEEPLQHDLDAVTAIHRLRSGQVHRRFENARAILVSTNTSLARATAEFFRDHYGVGTFAPICIPDHQFATLAWLKKPMRAPDLPMKYVLADAFAGLNPPESLWREYVKEINKLEASGGISSEDYHLLRYTPAAKEALMGFTLGGSRPFLEGSVPEILARAAAAARVDAERKLREEAERRERAEIALEEEAKRAEEKLAAVARANSANVKKLEESIAAEMSRAAIERASRYGRYAAAGELVGRTFRYAVLAVFVAFALGQLYATLPVHPFGPLPSWVPEGPFLLVATLIVGLVGVAAAVNGGSVTSLFAPVESRIARWVAARLASAFEPRGGTPNPGSTDSPG